MLGRGTHSSQSASGAPNTNKIRAVVRNAPMQPSVYLNLIARRLCAASHFETSENQLGANHAAVLLKKLGRFSSCCIKTARRFWSSGFKLINRKSLRYKRNGSKNDGTQSSANPIIDSFTRRG